jgi:type I restriction enzyme S subunit
MLEGKQKQIELLAEMKQRIIADSVTRGLNPNVKTKATNIPWLLEIPEHWEEQRMASLFTGEIEVNKDFEFKHAFKFNYGQLVPKNEIGEPEEYREVYVKYSKIKSGDILINGLNLNYDFVSQRVACAPSEGIITSAYVVCRPRTGVNYDYYTYLFKSMDSMKLFHGMGTGIRLTLSFKELKKQMIPIPPQSEQRAIVEFIKCKEAKFDSLTSKLQQEIESIKEYKQRLISDVVTGQIKVC